MEEKKGFVLNDKGQYVAQIEYCYIVSDQKTGVTIFKDGYKRTVCIMPANFLFLNAQMSEFSNGVVG